MKIDELTIGQAKEVIATMSGTPARAHPFVGKYVLCRCYSAGVHAGTLVSVDHDEVILRNSRRLWSWKAAGGIALSGVAQHGLADGKIDTLNPEIYLTGVIEIIPCSRKSEDSINAAA